MVPTFRPLKCQSNKLNPSQALRLYDLGETESDRGCERHCSVTMNTPDEESDRQTVRGRAG